MKNEYLELRKQCQDFATALLDHTRSSHELEVLLNHDPTMPAFEHGERMHLNRLKLAVKLRQKKVSVTLRLIYGSDCLLQTHEHDVVSDELARCFEGKRENVFVTLATGILFA